MMELRPIKKKSVEVEAAEALRNHVVGGGVPPGGRLTEMRLSEALGLSRTTVRTALHQLANEGLVVQLPYTGWSVTSLSSTDAWELYTLRGSLEALAARLLAENLDSDKKGQLHRAFDALVVACGKGDEVAIVDRDLALHKLIVSLSGHRRLAEQYRLIEQQIRLYLIWSDRLMPSVEDIIATHRPIVEAIVAGDGRFAEGILRDHNETAGRVLFDFLKQREAAGVGREAPPPARARNRAN
ncbi:MULTISPECIES: GntR family transcriptional regulator [unclassified Inquilinus]|uniref:GntR family transcriptional regulator n=1 Tax=unclassified Inquilinus TaxID=2645927 RepID=UPI003F8EAEBD